VGALLREEFWTVVLLLADIGDAVEGVAGSQSLFDEDLTLATPESGLADETVSSGLSSSSEELLVLEMCRGDFFGGEAVVLVTAGGVAVIPSSSSKVGEVKRIRRGEARAPPKLPRSSVAIASFVNPAPS